MGPKGKGVLAYIASLADGNWHDLREARRRVGDRELEVLQRTGMLEIDGRGGRIRMGEFSLTINSDWIRSLGGRALGSGKSNGDNSWST
jgi:hypothetical protein